ncbi:ProQ/FINO family protein [Guyparkeria sp. SCN-R1]|uniref:ProQ/FINO family protein n=1 Tax=Guyparkeria sp. SCN-R1 TaxID=2341113 RepID=UPI0013152C3E|nr:ProQ/FinO family protein [Guyparkeria sp. SCN-R1]
MTADEHQATDPKPETTGTDAVETTPEASQEATAPAEQTVAEGQSDSAQGDQARPQVESAAANQPKKPRVHPREAVKQFEAAWPEAFSSDPKQVKPLAIGILQQILADRPTELDGLNSKAIRAAMKFYTSRLSYHIAMKNAEHRVDLKGEPAEPVDDKARSHAEEQIKAIHAARDAKRAEQGETEEGGEKKPRRSRKPAGKGPRKAANGGQGDKGDKPRSGQEGGKRRTDRRPNKSGEQRKSEQADPALKNLSMEEKLDRLAQRFGQGVYGFNG